VKLIYLLAEAKMETQNITLTLPLAVLRQIKVIAAKRQISVSRLLTEELSNLIAREKGYARARARHLACWPKRPIWARAAKWR